MLYCRDCQLLCEQECPQCGSRSLREPQANDPVLLGVFEPAIAFGVESILKDNHIPYEKFGNLGAAVTLYVGTAMETYRFFVPYGEYRKSVTLVEELTGPAEPFQEHE